MSSSLRSKTYYGHSNNDRTTGSNNDVTIVQTTADNVTDVSNNTSNASGNGNGTNYSSFGHPYQHESSVSSTQIGFFLFLLGLFASGIFLYLLKNRYAQMHIFSQMLFLQLLTSMIVVFMYDPV